jgi:hypothetical protein
MHGKSWLVCVSAALVALAVLLHGPARPAT